MQEINPTNYIKMNKEELCEIYNNSDIEALEYMLPFCPGELKELCERLIALNMETTIGWGREDYTNDELEEYYNGKWKLLSFFGIENRSGDAYYNGVMYGGI